MGCGKSYDTFDYLTKKDRALIFDVNCEYDKNGFSHPYFKKPYYLYNTVDAIQVNQINSFKGIKRILPSINSKPIGLNGIFDLSLNILDNYMDGYLLLEDTNRYMSFNKDFVSTLSTLRSKNIHLILHFQSLKALSDSKLIGYADVIRLYHTNDEKYVFKLSFDKHIKHLLFNAQDNINSNNRYTYIDMANTVILNTRPILSSAYNDGEIYNYGGFNKIQ